jgi:hypothetical protein
MNPNCFRWRHAAAIALAIQPVIAVAQDAPAPETLMAAEASDGQMAAAEETASRFPPAERQSFVKGGGRLLLTSGVTQVEGASGGGLTPWAFIGGYGTRNEFGASAFATGVNTQDYSLATFGGLISFRNRVELSVARQSFNLNAVGAALGLGRKFSVRQTVIGAKVKLVGDAVLEQDSLLPQIAAGVQYKRNDEEAIVKSLGARKGEGVDFYLTATKVILSESLLLNGTARLTKANQFGILGFGGPGKGYSLQGEGSVAVLLNRKLAVGAEYRMKPNNLGLKETDAFDFFAAYTPTRNIAVTVAYADLGRIASEVTGNKQRGVYASLQLGF